MNGAILPLAQYVFMAWYSFKKKKAQGQLYLYRLLYTKNFTFLDRNGTTFRFIVLHIDTDIDIKIHIPGKVVRRGGQLNRGRCLESTYHKKWVYFHFRKENLLTVRAEAQKFVHSSVIFELLL
jgi:hypothetical protein